MEAWDGSFALLRVPLEGTTSFTDIPDGTAWENAVTVPQPVPATGYKFKEWTPVFTEKVTSSQTFTAINSHYYQRENPDDYEVWTELYEFRIDL